MKYDRKIIVTGGAGFIGSTFLNLSVPKYPNYYFINIDSLTSISNIDNVVVSDSDNYYFNQIDIRDKAALEKVFQEENVTDVINFAAESHVDVSIENPQIFVETNINGTANLLSLAQKHNITRFLQVSTDEVYGALKASDEPWTELSPLQPNSPYSASKAASDCLVRAFHVTYGLNTITTRCSNNYGPRQDSTKFIPNSIKHLLEGKKIPVYGKGENIRDWLYVEDHVQALDLLFHEGESGSIYNIGGGTEKYNYEVATLLAEMAGKKDAIEFVTDRRGHDFRYSLVGKPLNELDWEPKVDFKTGLNLTFEWYKENH